MSPPSRRCSDTWQTLPELTLGIADGEERALALEHLAGCRDCRREVEELSAITDDLLTLVPAREPPAGFEARVLERINDRTAPARPRRRRLLKRLSFAGAALAGAAAMAIVLTLAFSSDRRLASQYRAALDGANGQFFESAQLRTPDGQRVGTVFGYQGSPSWLFYVLDHDRDGVYREQLVTRTGRTITMPPFRLVAASWGISTPVPVRDIALVRLVRQPHGNPLEARLPVVER
jgi:Putative zinc-finger